MRKLLRTWLGINQLEDDVQQMILAYFKESGKLLLITDSINDRLTKLEAFNEDLSRGDVEFKLAQAKSSLKILTSFLNEIWYKVSGDKAAHS